MMYYEYKIINSWQDGSPENEFELNELGKEGWQLAAILPSHLGDRFYFMRFVTQRYCTDCGQALCECSQKG